MPYLIGYIALFCILNLNKFVNFSPTITWILGYIVLFFTIRKKNPLDPRAWMFFAWGLLFVNVFSGVIYIPDHIHFIEPLSYIVTLLFTFHIGYEFAKTNEFKFNLISARVFLSQKNERRLQLFLTICGLAAILGSLAIVYEIFFIQGMSLDGGERRAQFRNASFTPYVLIGVIVLSGSYFSALSLFFGGNNRNKILGILSLGAIALSSMAMAGKQGILIALLIVLFGYSVKRFYKIKIILPIYIKLAMGGLIFLFFSYIISLSSDRHQNVDTSELFNETQRLNPQFVDEMSFIPAKIQNTFAEFFGYYGDQLGTFAERWELDNYPKQYSIIEIPPRILNPFTWFERQIIKIFPIYSEIYPTYNLNERINNQTNGYFGLANWQTSIIQGLRIYGFLGQIIIVFLHGFISRKLYESNGKRLDFKNLHMSMLNNFFLAYTIMMNFLGETSAFFYFLMLLIFYIKPSLIKSKKVILKNKLK
jgi:hypothetical protein